MRYICCNWVEMRTRGASSCWIDWRGRRRRARRWLPSMVLSSEMFCSWIVSCLRRLSFRLGLVCILSNDYLKTFIWMALVSASLSYCHGRPFVFAPFRLFVSEVGLSSNKRLTLARWRSRIFRCEVLLVFFTVSRREGLFPLYVYERRKESFQTPILFNHPRHTLPCSIKMAQCPTMPSPAF